MTMKKPLETITEESNVHQLAKRKPIHPSKMGCKDYYTLFQVKWVTQPTSVQSWSKHYPPLPTNGITYLRTSQKCQQTIN